MKTRQPPARRKAAAQHRPASITPARKCAFEILLAIELGNSHSDELLLGSSVSQLSESDRNLVTALVLGVLRWQIRLDHQLQSMLDRPGAKLDVEVRIALRLGAFQILHMDRIPARAAIDESVKLTKRAGHRFASGMVNAVLRKLSQAKQPFLPDQSAPDLALSQAHPAWIVDRWARLYGLDAARAFCHHGQSQPALCLRGVDWPIDSELKHAAIVLEPGALLTSARRVVSGDVSDTKALSEGRLRIQDEGSQLIGEIAASVCGSLGAGRTPFPANILDACAAPGGKTLILAERNPEARIVACESSQIRFEHLRQRLSADGGRIACRLADVTAMTEVGVFDFALADVPCSGTGTLGRNPEIRHRLRLRDLFVQADRQRSILAAALRAVRAGGLVVYSTCSMEPEENEEVVACALADSQALRQVSLLPCIESLLSESILTADAAAQLRGAITEQGALRLFPGAFRTDGFFIALLEKSE